MSHLTLPASTVEYIQCRVRADADGTDPNVYDVFFAFLPKDVEPVPDDWEQAEWAPGGPPYHARQIAQPGAGVYVMWVRIDAASEVVVRKAGIVEFEEEAS